MSGTTPEQTRKTWSPRPLIARRWLRWLALFAVIGYLALALITVPVDGARVLRGFERSGRLFGEFLQPDFTSRWRDIRIGILESLTMTVVSTAVGVLLALPTSLGAARTLAVTPVYLFCRGYITVVRTFPEIIIGIVFVVMMGFGPFAGFLTLTLATTGFIAKLMAEEIESVDGRQLEAIRATGASWAQVVLYAVVPQVMPRFIGLSVYRLDINFRESTILGIVGAGGIGATLNTAMARYDFSSAGAILIIIIGIVLVLEYGSSYLRKRLQ